MTRTRMLADRRRVLAGAAAAAAALAAPAMVRAQGGALKVGVLLPAPACRPVSARIASAASTSPPGS
jgi:hypothetical protein